MGSDPQYAKYPNLSLAQDIFNLTNPSSADPSRQTSLKKLQDAISEKKMAPLYRYLAHPTDGILNTFGEGSTRKPSTQGARKTPGAPSTLKRRPSVSVDFPWDEELYKRLRTDNESELESFQKEEDEAAEQAGDTEIQAAKGKRAEFWARVGDKDKAIAAYEAVFEKTGVLGTKIDIVLAIIRMGMFFGDRILVKREVDRAKTLVDTGGDWDRRNRLKAYQGLHLLTIRSYNLAAPLLLDSLSTFTSYELCSYSSLVVYSVLAGSVSLKRVDFKSKVVDAPEIRAILGDGEDKLSALSGATAAGPGAGDEEMDDASSATPAPAATAVNLTALGTDQAAVQESEAPVDFTPLAGLVRSLYVGNYQAFFLALAAVEDTFLSQDRYLYEHRGWFVREMRLRGYQQLLQSYRVVGMQSMAKDFGISVDFLDRDLAKFIAADRIPCTIDRVNGIIETNRPDDKNKQYADVVKQGDALITKLQKYGQAVRLRGNPACPASKLSHPSSRTMSSSSALRRLNIDNINPNVKEAKYGVRGELAIRSEKYRAQLRKGYPPTPPEETLPFDQVISANIGNPQQLDQKPITFFRQVLSILEYPPLLEKEEVLRDGLGYKQDVIDRARWLLDEVKSVGAYSTSQGVPGIRESVARYIEKRDGYPSDAANIFLSAGASSGVNSLMNVICANPETGVLVPIPQYPLYTATLAVLNARCVPYYLEENRAWATDIDAIKQSYKNAKAQGTDVRAIVIINPGNPTGASLSADDVRNVLTFAAEEKLVVLADEVYQTNVFIGTFHSFKKALRDLQKEIPGKFDNLELASLNSISKGMVGECGHRGGYFELTGFDPQVAEQIYKFVSIMLCAPVTGQCLVEMQVNPPKEGDPSYPLYKKEYDAIAYGLESRANALYEQFKKMEGVECQSPQGSMYLFPTIHVPRKAVEQAKKEGRTPDEFYCFRLLDATGICVVPGSGFGQKEGTLHFRTTFLAPGTEWVGKITDFHKRFMDEFRD
ncbi:MAG: hypothetical protein Q9216_004719 [Gyalolechia sp. 2 TL-2023]